jgi:hypothetical protein
MSGASVSFDRVLLPPFWRGASAQVYSGPCLLVDALQRHLQASGVSACIASIGRIDAT